MCIRDRIYASEQATFWEIFARIGLPLEGGAAWLLTRSLSLPLAKEMALLSEPLSAQQAFEWRLINGCVPAEQLETVAGGVAGKLATLAAPSKGPAASGESRDVSARLGHIKGQLNAAWEQSMWQTFREESCLLYTSSELDMAEGSQKCTARLKIERVRVKVVLLRRLVAG